MKVSVNQNLCIYRYLLVITYFMIIYSDIFEIIINLIYGNSFVNIFVVKQNLCIYRYPLVITYVVKIYCDIFKLFSKNMGETFCESARVFRVFIILPHLESLRR